MQLLGLPCHIRSKIKGTGSLRCLRVCTLFLPVKLGETCIWVLTLDQAVALHAFAVQFAGAAHSLSLLAGALF